MATDLETTWIPTLETVYEIDEYKTAAPRESYEYPTLYVNPHQSSVYPSLEYTTQFMLREGIFNDYHSSLWLVKLRNRQMYGDRLVRLKSVLMDELRLFRHIREGPEEDSEVILVSEALDWIIYTTEDAISNKIDWDKVIASDYTGRLHYTGDLSLYDEYGGKLVRYMEHQYVDNDYLRNPYEVLYGTQQLKQQNRVSLSVVKHREQINRLKRLVMYRIRENQREYNRPYEH